MLRRFEIYKVRHDAPQGTVARMERSMRECGRFIPEVLHSVVGRNLSQADAQVIWEHAYESPEAYDRYMEHPYHANILDRYLLHDSPERITEDNGLACGLVGYEIAKPDYYMNRGVRRLVLLGVREGAPKSAIRQLEERLRAAREEAPQMTLSVVAENSMGRAWRPSIWSHLWEQGFESLAALRQYLWSDSPLARAERSGWWGEMNGLVVRSVDFYYVMHRPL